LETAYEPGATIIFRLLFVPFGLGIVACALDDTSILVSSLDDYLRSPVSNDGYVIPMFGPCIMYWLVRASEYQRAAELMAAYLNNQFMFQNMPNTVKWALRWNIFSQLQQELEAHFGAEEFKQMMQQGLHRDREILYNEARQFLVDIVKQG
jgi:hypothetical protein